MIEFIFIQDTFYSLKITTRLPKVAQTLAWIIILAVGPTVIGTYGDGDHLNT